MEAPWPGPAGAAWWLTGEWQGEDTPVEAESSSALQLILALLPSTNNVTYFPALLAN